MVDLNIHIKYASVGVRCKKTNKNKTNYKWKQYTVKQRLTQNYFMKNLSCPCSDTHLPYSIPVNLKKLP